MIIVTGAAGFIGSVVAGALNACGYRDLVLVDRFDRPNHELNYTTKECAALVPRDEFFAWVAGREHLLQAVIHLGARTDTTEQHHAVFDALNVDYSKRMWALCTQHQVPLIYASSAATYGDGALGFNDDHATIPQLAPLNPYGTSKQQFDLWALAQPKAPFFWAGLKFFNVYGPNDYHKGRMASVVFHAANQIRTTGKLKLFRSHRADYTDGGQRRDFVYVKDVASVVLWLMENRPTSAIYNLGSGTARPFQDLGTAVFRTLGLEPSIEYIDIPADIRSAYQYFTEARMDKLRQAGYAAPFHTLEDGIHDYLSNYLLPGNVL